MSDIKNHILRSAAEYGFDLVRITGAEDFTQDREAALERIRTGRMKGLPWYNEARVQRGSSPAQLLPGARSVICLGLSYSSPARFEDSPSGGKVARYAWVKDYHRAMKRRMRDLVRDLSDKLGTTVAARWYVDDGPMLDRAAAFRSGLGWFGKNTNILTPTHGSWVFLGQIITDLDLEADQPLKKSCGACVRCIDDCPTGAIVAPYELDNERCISYQTIENQGPIPRELRPLMQDWVFGCDICQDVCPVNRKAGHSNSPIPDSDGVAGPGKPQGMLDLLELLAITDAEFLKRFQGTPVMRAKRMGMQRNACVALGNAGDERAVSALATALETAEPLVRGHAAWALGRIGATDALRSLEEARSREQDPYVFDEINAALGELAGLGA